MNNIDELIIDIKLYIDENYIPRKRKKVLYNGETLFNKTIFCNGVLGFDDELHKLDNIVSSNLKKTWQESLFAIIDYKKLDEVEVYKNAGLTKQTFSKIRSDKNYHPDKNTAIQLCFGLNLNLDESLDLISKAGYTLSYSIKKDLVIRYLLENNIHNIYEADNILEALKLKQFFKNY